MESDRYGLEFHVRAELSENVYAWQLVQFVVALLAIFLFLPLVVLRHRSVSVEVERDD